MNNYFIILVDFNFQSNDIWIYLVVNLNSLGDNFYMEYVVRSNSSMQIDDLKNGSLKKLIKNG